MSSVEIKVDCIAIHILSAGDLCFAYDGFWLAVLKTPYVLLCITGYCDYKTELTTASGI